MRGKGKRKRKKKRTAIPKINPKESLKTLIAKRWWIAILDSNKIIAAGTLAVAFITATAIYYSNRQWHQEHRPNVVFSRPIEMIEPMTCDPNSGQGTAHFKVWVKNIGNEDAQSVLPVPWVQIIFESPKDHEQTIEQILSRGRTYCGSLGKIEGAAPGIPLHAGAETGIDMPTNMASSDHPKDRRMQIFATAIVYYREQDGTPHASAETEWLMLPDGTRSFVCGQPIYGRFDVYPGGSCEN